MTMSTTSSPAPRSFSTAALQATRTSGEASSNHCSIRELILWENISHKSAILLKGIETWLAHNKDRFTCLSVSMAIRS